ncbi:MAG: transposase family protein [Lachnospiraceae bacterium]|nr:transposase family protein [Lachnospiraceae bacterium]
MLRKKKLNAAEELVHLLQLPPDVIVDHVEHALDEDTFFLNLPLQDKRICPFCKSNDCIVRGSALTQTIRHIPVSGRKISLVFSKRRMYCENCSSSYYETPYWVLSRLKMSIKLY